MLNKTSKIFWPLLITPKNATVKNVEALSRSQKLMTELGLVKSSSNGTFQIMPIAQRAIDKCIDLVQRRMDSVDGQKISLPVLTDARLWKKSGRLNGDITEFYMLRDRHNKDFLLSPTHEEAVTAMLATAAPISYRQLPLRLYQIGSKFRDELKARFGLIRAKEFLMKDMYSFDRSKEDAYAAYEKVNVAYEHLFQQLEVPFVKVKASAGIMGGHMSHEYHYLTETGEDHILRCNKCAFSCNVELTQSEDTTQQHTCPQCKNATMEDLRGIEIGHAFLLGDKYSKPLGATFLQENGKPESLIMGCYGIGISRLVAAALEVLSTETELRWPTILAPFDVCLIGPKHGSKEQLKGETIEQDLCKSLLEQCNAKDVLHDDRKSLTIGKRLIDAKRMGYPIIVVIGNKSMENIPKIELHINNNKLELEPSEVMLEIAKYTQRKLNLLST